MPHYDLKRSGAHYMFNLRADNHEIVLTSERYTSKSSAQNGIASVQAHAAHDANYRRLTNSGNAPYFVLKAGNGKTIGTSEAYSSASAAEDGIAWVRKRGPHAPTKDHC
jgi:uncharacterized protein